MERQMEQINNSEIDLITYGNLAFNNLIYTIELFHKFKFSISNELRKDGCLNKWYWNNWRAIWQR